MLPCWPSSRTVAPCSRSSPHRSLPLLQSRPRPHRRRRPSPKVRACCSMTLASQRNRLQERRRRPTAPAMNAATHCSGLPHWPSIRTTTWPSHTLVRSLIAMLLSVCVFVRANGPLSIYSGGAPAFDRAGRGRQREPVDCLEPNRAAADSEIA